VCYGLNVKDITYISNVKCDGRHSVCYGLNVSGEECHLSVCTHVSRASTDVMYELY
jgi:hypothetical protein